MKRLHYRTYYQGDARIELWYEWEETDNFPQVNLVSYKEGQFCHSQTTELTPEAAGIEVYDYMMNN